jgi:hypothetical protein
MSARIQSLPVAPGPVYLRPAQVVQTVCDGVYRVRLDGREGEEIAARTALPMADALTAGDRVLVAGEGPAAGFIIGLLSAPQTRSLRTDQGAGARLRGQGADQCIAVHDAGGRILFEYYPASGKSLVRAPEGDLHLSAPGGCVAIEAGREILLNSPAQVAINGRQGVRMASGGQSDLPEQRLDLDGDGVRLGVHQMTVTAGRAEIHYGRATCRGQQLDSTVTRARLVYGKLELLAQRIRERSEEAIRHVRGLCQMQAGRMRTLVSGACHIQSERTAMTAKEEVRIDGKKINLG